MQAERRTVTTTRHEYFLPTPCAVAEVLKAIDLARSHLPERRQNYDDALMVESGDREIVIYWEEATDG